MEKEAAEANDRDVTALSHKEGLKRLRVTVRVRIRSRRWNVTLTVIIIVMKALSVSDIMAEVNGDEHDYDAEDI